MEKSLTVNEVAERLSVHPKTIYNLLERHELRGIKVGRVWRISMEAFEEYIRNNSYFDQPLTLEEIQISESAWEDYLSGEDKGESLDTVKRDLLGEKLG